MNSVLNTSNGLTEKQYPILKVYILFSCAIHTCSGHITFSLLISRRARQPYKSLLKKISPVRLTVISGSRALRFADLEHRQNWMSRDRALGTE